PAGRVLPGLLREWLGGTSAVGTTTQPRMQPEPELVATLAGVRPAARGERVLAHVRALVGQVLGLGAAVPIGVGRPRGELGLDSLLAIEPRTLLGRSLGRALPATLLFDYPTLAALRDYLLQQLPGEQVAGAPAALPAEAPGATEEAIAIVGVGCRLPG